MPNPEFRKIEVFQLTASQSKIREWELMVCLQPDLVTVHRCSTKFDRVRLAFSISPSLGTGYFFESFACRRNGAGPLPEHNIHFTELGKFEVHRNLSCSF